mmetsp:Transcript_3364/g.7301  ORF Transcript_3364/g.7301 Transcript_3364/m.7301 type:complete len:188 (-) Transcript_3364:92-655(-)
MTTRNETETNEGIAHRMVRCVGRAVNSFLAPDDTVRKLDILIEEAKEEDKFLEKETEHLRKVDDYLMNELKARGLTYPPLADDIAAAAAPAAAPDRARASVFTVPFSKPIDRVRLLAELIEMAEEDRIRSIELREKEIRQQSKVERFLENKLRARGLTHVPSANATKNEELAEMVDVLNANGGSVGM